jgi:hypothetical protein
MVRSHKARDRRARNKAAIIRLIASGLTRVSACRRVGVNPRIVARWVERDQEFAARYRYARIEQTHVLADKAIEIAGQPIAHGSVVSVDRNRLRVDALKWLCSKLAPRHYDET